MKLDLHCEIQQSIITVGRVSLQQKHSVATWQLYKTFLFSAVQCSAQSSCFTVQPKKTNSLKATGGK
jgi:hypothetical protein